MLDRPSRCSAGKPLQFAYYPDAPSLTADAIRAASQKFHDLMHIPGRLWSPFSWPLEARRFAKRLEAACSGDLVPVDHVKDIDRAGQEYLFEIRWDVAVTDRTANGSLQHRSVPVRLYHAEPADLLDMFVGLHVHEKAIVRGDRKATNALQDVEIGVAVGRFWEGRPLRWGIP